MGQSTILRFHLITFILPVNIITFFCLFFKETSFPFPPRITCRYSFAAVAGIMVFISSDELLPSAKEYGEHHLSIYGLILGMMVLAVSLLLFLSSTLRNEKSAWNHTAPSAFFDLFGWFIHRVTVTINPSTLFPET